MSNTGKNCYAPFRELLIDTDGSLLPCCEYKGGTASRIGDYDNYWQNQLTPLRETIAAGGQDPGCNYCIAKESTQAASLRTNVNSKYSNIPPNLVSVRPDAVEIRLGNYCNLKCIMCGSYASSSIAQEVEEHRNEYFKNRFLQAPIKTVRWWEETGALERVIELTRDAKSLHFTGGEPMMVPELIDMLSSANANCCISFNTNLTRVTDRVLAALSRFRKVSLTVSLEGVGAHNDYIRFGSKWEQLDTTIRKLIAETDFDIQIGHVLQHTSVFALPALLEYGKAIGLGVYCNAVYDPLGHLTVHSVSDADAAAFETTDPTAQGWIGTRQFNPALHRKFRSYVSMLDGIRGTDFWATFNPNWN